MQTFVVISTAPDHGAIKSALETVYANASENVTRNVWLVADQNVTAGEVCLKLERVMNLCK